MMKFKKSLKKGFTLVELIVVIAIIAILAAVSVVSYIAFINQANQSSDEQAVAQMNTILQSHDTDATNRPGTVDELLSLLSDNGLDAKDYKALYKDRFFFWDKEKNRVLYTDYTNNNYNVLFPQTYKGQTKVENAGKWLTLSGTIKAITPTVTKTPTTATVAVSSAEELYGLSLEYTKNSDINAKETTITLSGNIDASGAVINFKNEANVDGGRCSTNKPIVIKSATEGTPVVISGLAQKVGQFESTQVGKIYGTGLVPYASNNVTIQDVTIDQAEVGDYSIGSTSLFVGVVQNGATVSFKNCKITNSTLKGLNKVGPFVGQANADNATIIFDGTNSISNTSIECVGGEAGKVIGSLFKKATVTGIKTKVTVGNDVKINLVADAGNKSLDFGTSKVYSDQACSTEVTGIVKNAAKICYKYKYTATPYEIINGGSTVATATIDNTSIYWVRIFNENAYFCCGNSDSATLSDSMNITSVSPNYFIKNSDSKVFCVAAVLQAIVA